MGFRNPGAAVAVSRIDPALLQLVDVARESLEATQRRQRARKASTLIQGWKDEGIYPFGGPAADPLEAARRDMFDICALGIDECLEVFRTGTVHDRRFTLAMLKATLEAGAGPLKQVLAEVFNLPAARTSELLGLMQLTSLSSMIECSRLVTDRLHFLTGLESMLFDIGNKRGFRERGQLHRLIENETWIFGEEFRLTSSGESLNTVLRKHVHKLDMGKGWLQQAVLRDDGKRGFIDFVLGRELPAPGLQREFLVVELKRPMKKVDMEAKGQIERYAMAVASDERFDKANTRWTFIALSNEMTPEATRMVQYMQGAFGCTYQDATLRIGLCSWSGVLNMARVRMEALRSKLNCTVSSDQGMAWLRQRYADYLS